MKGRTDNTPVTAPDTPPVDDGAPPPSDFRPTDTLRLEDAAPAPDDAAAPPPSSDEGPAPGSQTPHARGMEAILARRREQMEREQGESERVGLQQPEATPTPLEAAPPVEAVAPPAPVAPVTPTTPPAVDPPRIHRVVVRGQTFEMPEEDVLRAAGHAIELEAARRETARPQPVVAPPDPPPAPLPPIDRTLALDYAKAIQYGDEEAAADALVKMTEEITRRVQPGPAIDPVEIANQVYARVNTVNTMEGALQRFAANYDDIVSDNEATELAAIKADKLRNYYQQRGIPKTIDEIMTEAGNAVRATKLRWNGASPDPTPQPTPPVPPAPQAPAPAANGTRVAIKRATPQAPAASAAPQPADTGPRLESGVTGAQTVAWMRQQRGQPVYR